MRSEICQEKAVVQYLSIVLSDTVSNCSISYLLNCALLYMTMKNTKKVFEII